VLASLETSNLSVLLTFQIFIASIFNEENLRAISQVLLTSNAKLVVADFIDATKNAKENDFLYFDPPYLPKSPTASFTCYTSNGFSIKDQNRLANWSIDLSRRGCKVILSNSDTPEIHEIYKTHQIEVVIAARAINCKGNGRKGHTELIIQAPRIFLILFFGLFYSCKVPGFLFVKIV
jgi:DNA adenine methylase